MLLSHDDMLRHITAFLSQNIFISGLHTSGRDVSLRRTTSGQTPRKVNHIKEPTRVRYWSETKAEKPEKVQEGPTCPKPTHMMANVTKTLQIIVRSFRSSALCRPWHKYSRVRSSAESKFDDKGEVLPESPSADGGFDSQSQHSYSHALPVLRSPSGGEIVVIIQKQQKSDPGLQLHRKSSANLLVKTTSRSKWMYANGAKGLFNT